MDRPAKIIVLDDEIELRNMLQRFLRGQGFDVRVAEDGKRLDRYLEREPFDLLVLDLMIGEEDGLAICARLRAQGQTLPILMLTAKGDPLDKVLGLETGADDYLAKPFLPRELVARINALLRRQKIASGDVTVTSQCVRFGVALRVSGAFDYLAGEMRVPVPAQVRERLRALPSPDAAS